MNTGDMDRRISEIIAESDPEKFDGMVDDLVDDIVDQDPDGPSFYTVKSRLMTRIRQTIVGLSGDEE